jgi:hypothetical protein
MRALASRKSRSMRSAMVSRVVRNVQIKRHDRRQIRFTFLSAITVRNLVRLLDYPTNDPIKAVYCTHVFHFASNVPFFNLSSCEEFNNNNALEDTCHVPSSKMGLSDAENSVIVPNENC